MQPNDMKKAAIHDYVLAGALIVTGLLVAVVSLNRLPSAHSRMAQAVQPAPSDSTSPKVPVGKNGASEPNPVVRPTTPAPQPATPDEDAQKAGSRPALPAAPAEKMGEPVGK